MKITLILASTMMLASAQYFDQIAMESDSGASPQYIYTAPVQQQQQVVYQQPQQVVYQQPQQVYYSPAQQAYTVPLQAQAYVAPPMQILTQQNYISQSETPTVVNLPAQVQQFTHYVSAPVEQTTYAAPESQVVRVAPVVSQSYASPVETYNTRPSIVKLRENVVFQENNPSIVKLRENIVFPENNELVDAYASTAPSPVEQTYDAPAPVAKVVRNQLQPVTVLKEVGSSYGAPQKTSSGYEAPQQISSDYGAPEKISFDYGAPQQISSDYGAPVKISSDYGAPQQISSDYGAPEKISSDYGAPEKISSDYGATQQISSDYGAPVKISSDYGAPVKISSDYGAPVKISSDYGAPQQLSSEYGAPLPAKRTSVGYGPPGYIPPSVVETYIPTAKMTDSYYGSPTPDDSILKISQSLISEQPLESYGPPEEIRQVYGVPEEPKEHKHIYVHTAPQEAYSPKVRILEPINQQPEKHYQIIFVRAPTPHAPVRTEIQLPPPAVQKTLVYVLTKAPESNHEVKISGPVPTKPSPPEVYFIRYAANAPSSDYGAPSAGAVPTVNLVKQPTKVSYTSPGSLGVYAPEMSYNSYSTNSGYHKRHTEPVREDEGQKSDAKIAETKESSSE